MVVYACARERYVTSERTDAGSQESGLLTYAPRQDDTITYHASDEDSH